MSTNKCYVKEMRSYLGTKDDREKREKVFFFFSSKIKTINCAAKLNCYKPSYIRVSDGGEKVWGTMLLEL